MRQEKSEGKPLITLVENYQLFGDSEYWTEWTDYLTKVEGIQVNEDMTYDGYITHPEIAIKTLENIIRDEEKQRGPLPQYSLFNMSGTLKMKDKDFTQVLKHVQENAYMFMSVNFLKACGTNILTKGDEKNCAYILNPEGRIHVSAHIED